MTSLVNISIFDENMSYKLVIVESPNKCETIQGYLGKGYKVIASKGHCDDLATRGFGGYGVDIDNGFKATYIIPYKNKQTVDELKKAVKYASEVFLATDPDREGEAIAWHLTQILGLDVNTTKRLEFHEITREAIQNALNKPRTINMNLVDSQETRRIIDRIIGFKLSSLLQKNINSRSAGRVQSSTLKLIYDHDKEIDEFVPESFYSLNLTLKKGDLEFNVNYIPETPNKKITSEEENKAILDSLDNKAELIDIKKTLRKSESKPAFTTSTLQQEAFNNLHFSTALTTKLAQTLFEGKSINGEKTGLVTYIRTDSVRLSDMFISNASHLIAKQYGLEYLGKPKFKKIKGSQDAHEAIRPARLSLTPSVVKQYLTNDEYRLYKLIYDHTIASLMADKQEEVYTYIFKCGKSLFKCDASKVLFDGYTKLFGSNLENENSSLIDSLEKNMIFDVSNIDNEKNSTKPPLHYNEAKVVRLMEEDGIGRPSTYASTIKLLKDRKYIETVKGTLQVTEQGKKTTFVLNKYFPKFIETKYTANMESNLDEIQEGKETKLQVLTDFYTPFVKECDEATKLMYKDKPDFVEGRVCPKCGKPLVYKTSKYGKFIGCSDYPKCDYVESILEETGEMCPKCGKPLVVKYSKKGKKFVGCSNYPQCDYIKETPKKTFKKYKSYKKFTKSSSKIKK